MKLEMNRDKIRDFLIDLRKITREHGVIIWGCGCCGSPWLIEEESFQDDRIYYTDDDGENLTFDTLSQALEDEGRQVRRKPILGM